MAAVIAATAANSAVRAARIAIADSGFGVAARDTIRFLMRTRCVAGTIARLASI